MLLSVNLFNNAHQCERVTECVMFHVSVLFLKALPFVHVILFYLSASITVGCNGLLFRLTERYLFSPGWDTAL